VELLQENNLGIKQVTLVDDEFFAPFFLPLTRGCPVNGLGLVADGRDALRDPSARSASRTLPVCAAP